jgi:serine/threonine protein phosphatase PrpC
VTLGRIASITDTGRRRRRNEDAFVVRPPLFAVADGMGGAQAGEIASRLATEALREQEAGTGGKERVAALIQAANQRVYERSSVDAAASGMGTTITVALVENGLVSIGHVGDSRAYLVREGRLEQLTDDHSLVAELLRSGKLSPEEAETHPQRSVITRALGTDPDVDADTFSLEARPGDLFLLCSDGLTSMVADEEIEKTIEANRGDLDAAARELVRLANRGGGEDNITVVFFEIVQETETVEQTAELALPQADEDEEDTLDELDAIPTLGSPDTGKPAEREPRGRLATLAIVTGVLLFVALAALAVWAYLSS